MILIDTNIIIGCLRKNEKIINEIAKIGFENLAISTITVCEIYYGMYKGEKRETIEIINKFSKFYLDKNISKRAESLCLEYSQKGLTVADALIAATVMENNLQLFTLNKKDFDFIKGIKFYKPTQKLL